MEVNFTYGRRPKKNEVVVINIAGEKYDKNMVNDTIQQFQTVFPKNDIICLFDIEEPEEEKPKMGFNTQ